jgi:putative transposase
VSLLTKDQMREFMAANDFQSPEDIQRALTALFAETLQTMRDAELDTHLGYPKHAPGPKPTANRRNGRYPKQVTTA